jgi:long-subunit fatty acid transport protein
MLNPRPVLYLLMVSSIASQTELRVGYESKLKNGLTTVYAEVGPGYEWNKEGTPGEGVVVGEVGVKTPLTKNVGLAAKLSTEYGRDTEVLDIGGEVKVRLYILINNL